MTAKTAAKVRWYNFCVAFQRIDEVGCARVCQDKSSRYGDLRISQGPPLRCLLWIAYAPSEPNVPVNLWQQTATGR